MESTYMVVARDGLEYGPLDRDTIQHWYYGGRLDENSKVYEPGKHKFRLKEMFDLTVWRNPQLVREAAARAKDRPDFNPKTNIIAVPNERTSGMLVAGLLLLALGLVEALMIAGILVRHEYTPRGAIFEYLLAAVADLVLAAGLLRGNQKFRGWGLARSIIGAALILLDLATTLNSGWQLAYSGFDLLMCGGIAALLAGEAPSKLRIGAGAGAVLTAWSGLITVGFIADSTGHTEERDPAAYSLSDSSEGELAAYALPIGAFDDDALGVSLRLPLGWVLLAPENPIVNQHNAILIAAHQRSGCLATLEMVTPSSATGSTDDLVAVILIELRKSELSFHMLGRADVGFGGNRGVRVETTWIKDGVTFRGFTTACGAGTSCYILGGWCSEDDYEDAFQEFQSLEQSFRIRGTTSVPPIGITSGSSRGPVRSPGGKSAKH